MKIFDMLFRHEHDPESGAERPDLGESKVEEIASQKAHSDQTLRRVERVLSPADVRVRHAVQATSRAVRTRRAGS